MNFIYKRNKTLHRESEEGFHSSGSRKTTRKDVYATADSPRFPKVFVHTMRNLNLSTLKTTHLLNGTDLFVNQFILHHNFL